MKSQAACYRELRDALEQMPIVDCHDHTSACGPKYKDAIAAVVNGYFPSDVQSATSDQDVAAILDVGKPVEERWPLLDRAWRRTCHTGYAQVTRRVMQHFYGESALTLEALQRMQGKLLDLEDEATYTRILDEARIVARVEDCWPDVKAVVNGQFKPSPRGRLAIALPRYHGICNYTEVQNLVAPLRVTVTSLDEYMEACRRVFEAHKAAGAVTFKDQSAYMRSLDYGNPTRAEAEAVFNWFMEDPRRSAAYPDGVKPLDDYLWHAFMRMAREMDLPVQIHTGHMAGIRNDIAKTNAVYLNKTIELHREVRFDLFHANWPYDAEFLYLGKNYPNVALDFCWANIIDPIYCQRLFQQVLSAVPHAKIHGYGSDYLGSVDRAWAHADIARDNMAIALAGMVEMEYLTLTEARDVAYGWLFANANEFFRLGL